MVWKMNGSGTIERTSVKNEEKRKRAKRKPLRIMAEEKRNKLKKRKMK